MEVVVVEEEEGEAAGAVTSRYLARCMGNCSSSLCI
jgi:hypothetical protein